MNPQDERGIISPEDIRRSDEAAAEQERWARGHWPVVDHGPLKPDEPRQALEEQDRRIEEQAMTR